MRRGVRSGDLLGPDLRVTDAFYSKGTSRVHVSAINDRGDVVLLHALAVGLTEDKASRDPERWDECLCVEEGARL